MRSLIALGAALTLAACAGQMPRAAAPVTPPPQSAAPVDRMLGVYAVTVHWNLQRAADWSGEMRLGGKRGDTWVGTMRLTCATLAWVVTQVVVVTVVDGEMTVQGANVQEIEVPDDGGGYGWDVFKLRYDGTSWSSGGAAGQHAGTGTVTIQKQEVASIRR